jgi:hypothetical protein
LIVPGISGHENPLYDNTDESYGGSVFSSSSSSSGNTRSLSPEQDRQSPAVSGEARPSSPLSDAGSSVSPYEAIAVLPSGAMQVQHGKQIGGKKVVEIAGEAATKEVEPQFTVNPLFQPNESS